MSTNVQMVVNTQLQRIHVLLHKLGRIAYKADYVIDVTGGREHSTKQLTFDEANILIEMLDNQERALRKKKSDSADLQRKKIISCFREMGYIKGGKADMQRIYDWVLKYGYLHKPLNDYTAAELPKLVYQAQKAKDDYLSRL